MDMDDIYIQAQEDLEIELGREPTDAEIYARAQEMYEHAASAAYDRAKDYRKYGE